MASAEERKRQRELEEARKAGLAAPEVDEEGNAINPHIPQFMASAPWYLNQDKPGLKHQKNWKDEVKDAKAWYDRGAKVFQANKWRKGACDNCGSMAHKTKDCMERPRTKGARFTNKNIAADEKVEDIDLATWDAKRDRWNGYNPDDWTRQAERFEKVAAMRQEIRRKELLQTKFEGGEEEGEEEEEVELEGELQKEEDKVDESEVGGFGKVEKRVRTAGGGATMTVRNLRIREDTAKYLLNLDVNSAHYDPKSRSMREDPNPEGVDMAKRAYLGENFERSTGEVKGFGALNSFAVTSFEKGQDVHMQAMPSQAELAFRQFKQRKDSSAKNSKQSVAERYGDGGAQAPPDDLKALAQTEAYVEYDASGRVVRGEEVKARSRYEEDVLTNNHTAVWGSWWHEGQWGYACCHSTVKSSYCVGEVGITAAAEAEEQLARNLEQKVADEEAKQEQREAEERGGGGKKLEGHKPKADVWGTDHEEGLQLDQEKVREAMERLERRDRHNREESQADDRKRKYNSLREEEEEVTPEEMEAYRLRKARGEDPLAFMQASKEKTAAAGGERGYDYV